MKVPYTSPCFSLFLLCRFRPGPPLKPSLLGNWKAGRQATAQTHESVLVAKNTLVGELDTLMTTYSDKIALEEAKEWVAFKKRYQTTLAAIEQACQITQTHENSLDVACTTRMKQTPTKYEIDGKFFVDRYCTSLVKNSGGPTFVQEALRQKALPITGTQFTQRLLAVLDAEIEGIPNTYVLMSQRLSHNHHHHHRFHSAFCLGLFPHLCLSPAAFLARVLV
jgi:hypothetical protein